jgi:hypothetical protein
VTTPVLAPSEVSAARSAFAALVDYAGLFPPAACTMTEAVRRYARYRAGVHAWMLGSFVVPASRLGELEVALSSVDAAREPPWSISVLLGDRFEQDLETVAAAREKLARVATVASLETAPLPGSTIGALAERLPGDLPTFFEVPLAGDGETRALESRLEGVAAAGSFAKVRTGGVVATAVPGAAALARFVATARALRVPFKATAGLHHAVRGTYPLTYEPDSEAATMHGFLNLLAAALAAASAAGGADEAELVEILEERDAAAFRFSRRSVSWRAREWSLRELVELRRGSFLSFGSCSFVEPVDELIARGWLEPDVAAAPAP